MHRSQPPSLPSLSHSFGDGVTWRLLVLAVILRGGGNGGAGGGRKCIPNCKYLLVK